MRFLKPLPTSLAILNLIAAFRVVAAPVAVETGKHSEISRRMQGFVDEGTISGAVTLVARHDRILEVAAVGYADIGKAKMMREDNLFWIALMTKPITAVAVLMLQDAGQLNVEDPVEKYLPEFKSQWLMQEKTTNT